MDKDVLVKCISLSFSTYNIAKVVGKSQTTVRYWLKFYGLKTNRVKHNKNGVLIRYPTITPNKEINIFYCGVCGEKDPNKFYKRKHRCKTCHTRQITEKMQMNKRKAVQYKGGKCKLCGYCKNYAALDFHHLDPALKDINFKSFLLWTWDKLRKELDKCELMCGNCHAETHNPHLTINFGEKT